MIKKYLLINLILFLCSFVPLKAADEEFLPKENAPYLYLLIETENGTLIKRSPSGWISMDIIPEEGQVVDIGGKQIKRQTNIRGIYIKIGDFILSKQQSDTLFIDTIEKWNSILYQSILEAVE